MAGQGWQVGKNGHLGTAPRRGSQQIVAAFDDQGWCHVGQRIGTEFGLPPQQVLL